MNIAINDILLKLDSWGYISLAECIYNHFYGTGPKATKFSKITQNTRPLLL